jgi:amino acid adenylation domain-containing protein
LDTDWEEIAKESAKNTISAATAESLAYVIYTSGTTGQPKGVMISHHNLSRLFHAAEPWFHFTQDDIWTVFHSYAFDFSVWELWGALLYGGRAVIVPYWLSRSPHKFYELLAREKVTVLNQTPSAFRQLMQADSFGDNQPKLSLRWIIFGGEALDFQSLRPWFDRHGDESPRLVNMYGITETTVHVTYRVMKATDVTPAAPSLIGVPLPDLELYVLDRHKQLVPVGIPGELYVGGAGVGRGYLNQPEFTAERFLANPFRKGRLYKTGDLVRRLPNGDIEYLGRTDAQVKIRGFRIELGEIETVLRQHPAVRECVVISREEVEETNYGVHVTEGIAYNPQSAIPNPKFTVKRLVAYVVPRPESAFAVNELRSFLKQKLPQYMIPSAFVLLDALPLTRNGKVDRRTLPIPGKAELGEGYVAPRSALEQMLSGVWSKLLGMKRVGIRDNFFDLGGHSLLAVRLVGQIEKLTGKHLPVASLFQAPTIEEQAKLLRQEQRLASWESLVAIQPGGSRPPFFCLHAHDGGVLFWRDLARHLGLDQPFYALQAQGLDGRQPPLSRIEEMASHYIKEMRTLQPEGPYFIGGHCLGGLIAFEMAQQLYAERERVALLALFDCYAPRRKGSARRSRSYRYRYQAIRFFQRTVGLHVGNLLILEPQERLSYVKGKFNKALYKLYMGLGSAWIPAARARQNILKAGTQAARNYRPKMYPGKITLFRSTKLGGGISHDPQMGWGRLAGGGLETHLIPAYFAHMVYEPRVRVLAEELTVCLDSARVRAFRDERDLARGSSQS